MSPTAAGASAVDGTPPVHRTSVRERVRAAYHRIRQVDRPEVWIDLRPEADLVAEAAALDERGPAGLPLHGKLVAVKGNIDVAGLPTTAGCPAYAYRPEADAPVVARLRAAGALVLGTTNLDQFATGLAGTRSPYGAVRNAVDPAYVSGGSSAGSAVAVALGLVDLALGTDTAGSGRVPAAFNGIVGLKPTPGLLPTEGVVPACRSIDCVSLLARTVEEASFALTCLAEPAQVPGGRFRLGVPDRPGPLAEGWAEAFADAVATYAAAGAEVTTVDVSAFLAAARLLYGGAFVAERYTAVGEFVDRHPDDCDPVVRGIITAARDIRAHRLFADRETLAGLRTEALEVLAGLDALLLPTTTGHPTLAEVAADPVAVTARLGRFTQSTNVFGLPALAVPAGTVAGRPFGVMLVGAPHDDLKLAALATRAGERVPIAVVGAHRRGQPLNHELTSRGGRFVSEVSTSASIAAELWDLPVRGFGEFVARLPAPLAIGKVELADGTAVSGVLREPAATAGARDVPAGGGV